MTAQTRPSNTRHAKGRLKSGASIRPPKLSEKNHRIDAEIAPAANNTRPD